MSKLKKEDKFIDVSDYGRPIAKLIVSFLKNTSCTPIQVTLLFGLSGLAAIFCIITNHYYFAGFFLILKSILDAADGELARVKNTPSYTGRFLDSIFDIILNFLFLITICFVTKGSLLLTLVAFLCMQMQGTLYNYYYVILRNKTVGADTTSKIFEYKEPKAFVGETQNAVHITYTIFNILYSFFDKTIHLSDKEAYKTNGLPNWFMTLVSFYGLGFQLLIIAIFLSLQLENIITPFFIIYSIFIFLFIVIRKYIIK
jgi:phosphatidylglycerophosphate synthase